MSAAASTANTASARRIGVFGGAFDPPHCAHVALAEAAIAQLELDELRIIPTGQAWHKRRPLSAPEHRLQMARLAFSGLARVRLDERELRRAGPSYTIDTLEALHEENPGSALFLVIGGDQLAAFGQWRRWQDILARATVCVAERPPEAGAPVNPAAQISVSPVLPQSMRLHLPAMPISATAIRQHLAALHGSAQRSPTELAGLVPDAVARYISLHGLYQARPTPL